VRCQCSTSCSNIRTIFLFCNFLYKVQEGEGDSSALSSLPWWYLWSRDIQPYTLSQKPLIGSHFHSVVERSKSEIPPRRRIPCILPSVLRAVAPSVKKNIHFYPTRTRDQDSSVGIVTRYGLCDPGIEYRWGRVFPHPPHPEAHPASYIMGNEYFSRG
jgi:hypothetical protein